MKKFVVMVLAIMLAIVSCSCAFGDVAIDEEHFPDRVFREYIRDKYDKDGDGQLNDEEIATVFAIVVSYKNISSLRGIEYFVALENLWCSDNQLTSLNVSGCTALKSLWCFNNQLTSLNVSGCTALKSLRCYNNQLISLNVSGYTALESLSCYNNQLTSLNVSGCTALKTLECKNDQLTSLNVSGCTALERLDYGYSQLTSLDVSGCTALKTLWCEKKTTNQFGC